MAAFDLDRVVFVEPNGIEYTWRDLGWAVTKNGLVWNGIQESGDA